MKTSSNALFNITSISTEGQEIVVSTNHQFSDYLAQYPDELPQLEAQQFTETSGVDDSLNCHCYAVRLNSGYDGPADLLALYMDAQEAHSAVIEWFACMDYTATNLDQEPDPFKRNPRKEKIIVFGITPQGARDILASNKRISDELKSTLATVVKFNDGVVYPTHSICQKINGSWESKMGSGPVIEIGDPKLLGGGVYGEACFVFEKKRFITS
ncbi:hypothetical protein H0A36_23275 [Endozoicomonas sp. SM1973]|uniref:DUF7689 domain-containing protein n=1 Tax=Spartinivicinus marinus TaxID=2994442 RepID=A0A853IMD4_9GAMM|nr:hypothetical protein [Spartinivicinus marinus]MCX4027763.1 hypothetical protein [Spartinivicinus marinus]NYZ68946.1 hypothetical protein [Spartinivicinus marinus]